MSNSRYLNMDIVRYILSTAVIVAHYSILTSTDIPFPISSASAVGVFFGISGYLVCGSYLKHDNLKRYVKARARRILPPYLFVVLMCALGLVFVSSYSATEYFTDAGFWKYLASNICFLNFLQPNLPGVFEHGVMSAVNGSLWTLKVEWGLYLSIPLFFWGVRKYKWNIPLAVLIIFVCSFLYSYLMKSVSEWLGSELFNKLSYQLIGQLAYFYTGVLVYHFREKLADRKWWYTLPVVVVIYALIETNVFHIDFSYIQYICPMLLVFGTLLFSLSTPVSKYTALLGNVSYEMYLFHFPVIQLANYYHLNHYLSDGWSLMVVLAIVILISAAYHKAYESLRRKTTEAGK